MSYEVVANRGKVRKTSGSVDVAVSDRSRKIIPNYTNSRVRELWGRVKKDGTRLPAARRCGFFIEAHDELKVGVKGRHSQKI